VFFLLPLQDWHQNLQTVGAFIPIWFSANICRLAFTSGLEAYRLYKVKQAMLMTMYK
jgi:hypothetical protein